MNELEFIAMLQDAIISYDIENANMITETSTFEQAGLLTANNGLVVTMNDDVFQIKVVQSKEAVQ